MHEKHGMIRTPEYRSWWQMRHRCTRPELKEYPIYGGRGIAVCEKWATSFPAFFADIGKRPSPQHSLDRIDNNGNYEPGNCRWATHTEQMRNTRANKLNIEKVSAIRASYAEDGSRGRIQTIADQYGVNRSMISVIVHGHAWK